MMRTICLSLCEFFFFFFFFFFQEGSGACQHPDRLAELGSGYFNSNFVASRSERRRTHIQTTKEPRSPRLGKL